jgi:hypothetical protein
MESSCDCVLALIGMADALALKSRLQSRCSFKFNAVKVTKRSCWIVLTPQSGPRKVSPEKAGDRYQVMYLHHTSQSTIGKAF